MTASSLAPGVESKQRPSLTSIRRDDLAGLRDPDLVRARKKHDRDATRRTVDNEADELLPAIDAAAEAARQLKLLVSLAEWSGSEREDGLRLALGKLQAAATI